MKRKQLEQTTVVIAEVEKCGVCFTLSKCEKCGKKWLLIEAFYTVQEQEVGFVILNTKTEVEYQCGIFDYAGIPELDEFIENELFKTEVGKWADNLYRATR